MHDPTSRSRRAARLLVVVVAALQLTTGCTTTVPGVAAAVQDGAPSPGAPSSGAEVGPSDDAVAWTDDVCGALLPLATALSAPPQVDPSDGGALVDGLDRYFGAGVTALDTSLAGLAATGPSPVEGGDEVVMGLTGTLTTIRTSFADARTTLDGIDPADPSELVAVLPALLEPLEAFADLTDPTSGLRDNPELDRAAEQAPNCRALPG